MILLDRFHCPKCRGRLQPITDEHLACTACKQTVPIRAGVLNFVGGRAGTKLDAEEYDEIHRIDDTRVDRKLAAMQVHAGDRWPVTLGSVLEVGCGTGLFSRAMLEQGLAKDAVLTDVSLAMLSVCREGLERRGLLGRAPVTFATYSGTENAFRDAVFDTCAGTSVLHHILDVRAFLVEVFRVLKPGGRAFFMEPNLRFHRALMQTLADVLAQLHARGEGFSHDRQKLQNVLAEARRVILHQGDLNFLASLEDKHMFEAETFERMGLELGFATAEALPTAPQPTGTGIIATLCGQLGVGEAVRRDVMKLMPAYASRYLGLLAPRDRSAVFLLWLEKKAGPQARGFQGPPPNEEERYFAEQPPDPMGGLSPHWSMGVVARPTETGIGLQLSGWCLVNADILWVRITLDGVTRQAPVWRPRPDVQTAINGNGLYPAWNAMCSGVDTDLSFEGVEPCAEGLPLKVELVLASGAVLHIRAPERLAMGEEVRIPG